MDTLHTPHLANHVGRYARRFHSALPTGHHVASPLGAWILLALAAETATGEALEELENALGCSAEEAKEHADELLRTEHPEVSSAVAVWAKSDQVTEQLAAWRSGLPSSVEGGEVPDQTGADAWGAKHTGGLVKRFPIEVDDETFLVLASALATKVSWLEPFTTTPVSSLGESTWGPDVERVLRSASSHTTQLVETDRAGLVAVHAVRSADGLLVLSVVADEGVSRDDVISAAHEVAVKDLHQHRVSLFDVPVGTGHSWVLTEETREMMTHEDRVERTHALLPAWRAESDHDLMADRSFGFEAVSPGLAAMLPKHPDGHEVEAKQVAVAGYSRTGFEAAAVTALGFRAGSMPPRKREVEVREAELRFNRPYAVVAVTLQSGWDREQQKMAYGPWHQVPVFSAWVETAVDAGTDDPYED